MATQISKKRVFSGVQPTGKLHIGNYIGALSVWAKEQDNYDNIFCIVDMHALTIPEKVNPRYLHDKVIETAAIYLASGLDPKKSKIFIQSMVPEHTELGWILTCTTPLGWLQRMTQYKAKSAAQETIGTGLLAYPILQAADILLYDTNVVPVGEDQKQHIELTRDLAQRFNNLFGAIFTIPQPMIRTIGARIMGLDDPSIKMSKSLGELQAGHSIGIVDSPDLIKKAIKTAVTDSGREVNWSTAEGGIRNLLTMYQAMTGSTDEEMQSRFNGKGYGVLKQEVIDAVTEGLRPVREKYAAYMQDKAALEEIVREGAAQVSPLAAKKVAMVKESLGIDFSKKTFGNNQSKSEHWW